MSRCQILEPPNGSIYKATRHFQDMLKVEDPLVVALAQEHLFLCEWAEANFRPQANGKQKKVGDFPEVPETALKILRLTFKSLSNRVKHAAMRDEDSNLMVKAWYSEHIDWATTWLAIKIPITGQQSCRALPPFRQQTFAIEDTPNTGGGKGDSKRAFSSGQTGPPPKVAKSQGNMVALVMGSKQVQDNAWSASFITYF